MDLLVTCCARSRSLIVRIGCPAMGQYVPKYFSPLMVHNLINLVMFYCVMA